MFRSLRTGILVLGVTAVSFAEEGAFPKPSAALKALVATVNVPTVLERHSLYPLSDETSAEQLRLASIELDLCFEEALVGYSDAVKARLQRLYRTGEGIRYDSEITQQGRYAGLVSYQLFDTTFEPVVYLDPALRTRELDRKITLLHEVGAHLGQVLDFHENLPALRGAVTEEDFRLFSELSAYNLEWRALRRIPYTYFSHEVLAARLPADEEMHRVKWNRFFGESSFDIFAGVLSARSFHPEGVLRMPQADIDHFAFQYGQRREKRDLFGYAQKQEARIQAGEGIRPTTWSDGTPVRADDPELGAKLVIERAVDLAIEAGVGTPKYRTPF